MRARSELNGLEDRRGGHPLLYQAALGALQKWKYEPTYLNDRPIAVEMIVTITFQLSQ